MEADALVSSFLWFYILSPILSSVKMCFAVLIVPLLFMHLVVWLCSSEWSAYFNGTLRVRRRLLVVGTWSSFPLVEIVRLSYKYRASAQKKTRKKKREKIEEVAIVFCAHQIAILHLQTAASSKQFTKPFLLST